jgi:hypothetical protein
LRFSIVSLNRAAAGGGIFAPDLGAFSVERSIVVANAAWNGGGIWAAGEPPPIRLDGVTVYGNSAGTGRSLGLERAGGGLYWGSKGRLDRSWIGHNVVGGWNVPAAIGWGGGIALFSTGAQDHSITNTTIEGNLAEYGGGLYIFGDGRPVITHVTIARNRAVNPGSGGGVAAEGALVGLIDAVIAENLPVNCSELGVISAGHNLADDDSCALGAAGDLEGVDAELGPLGNYGGSTRTIMPLAGSPLVEGGTNVGILADQRGVSRPQLAQFDIGAVERRPGLEREQLTSPPVARPHRCDLDRNGRIDFGDLDRLIASFPASGGRFRGNAEARLRDCVASCTHAGCPATALIPKPGGLR